MSSNENNLVHGSCASRDFKQRRKMISRRLFDMLEISMNIQMPDPHGTYTLEFAAVLSLVLEKV